MIIATIPALYPVKHQHLLVLALAAVDVVACGTHLTSLDARAVLNQERACQRIGALADGGPEVVLANACVCGAKGILTRAGQPSDDAGACQ